MAPVHPPMACTPKTLLPIEALPHPVSRAACAMIASGETPSSAALGSAAGYLVATRDTVALEGPELRVDTREFRNALTRMGKVGIGFRRYDPPITREVMHEVRDVSNEWLLFSGRRERQFSLGTFQQDYVGSTPIVAATDAGGRILAFVNIVPSYHQGETTIDLMRRRTEAPNGIMDFLIVKSVEAARERGNAVLSLSLSALASVEKVADREQPDRSRAFLMKHLARFYDFEGLFRWKKKFAPEFEDRFLVYPDPLALPRVALALARAQSPGGLQSCFRRES